MFGSARLRRIVPAAVLAAAILLVLALTVLDKRAAATRPRSTGHTSAPHVEVIVRRLDQPKHLTLAPNGSLIVAVSGDGVAPASCTNGNQPSCLDNSGAIDEVSLSGQVRTLIGGLPSVSASGATGPVEAWLVGNRLQVLLQDNDIDTTTGANTYGSAGNLLGTITAFSATGGSPSVEASFGPFEAANNPDHSAGSTVAYSYEPGIESNPYSFVPYRGGYAVADAGANDLLFVSATGHISVLAVFPTTAEPAPAGTYGPTQKTAITGYAQAVPDSVAVGPDGALYLGALGGMPYAVGASKVYRVVPGHAPTVYARGLTSISDIAFDTRRRLLVLEIDRRGLSDPALNGGHGTLAPGELIRVGAHGAKTIIASRGLELPTGLAVARDGAIYIANHGTSTSGGQIVRVSPR